MKTLVRNNLKKALPNFSVPEGFVNMPECRTEQLIQRQPGKKEKELEKGKMSERERRKGNGEGGAREVGRSG